MRLAVLVSLLSLWAPVRAAEVVWAIVDSAPYHLDGPTGPANSVQDLGQGLTDHLIRGLAARMPGHRHRLVYLPRTRMWREMAAGRPVCYADAFKTPQRLRWAHFTAVTPPIRLLLVSRKGTLQGGQEQSLAQLMARPQLKGAFEFDRSYGVPIDNLIAKAGPHARRMALPDSPQLLRMLEAGRMDYLVEYAPAVMYLQERLTPPPALDFHAIVEERQATPSYVACTRGAWGRSVVEAIDQAMRDWAQQPEVQAALLRWLPPDIAQQELPTIERFYRERALRSDFE